MCGYKKIKDYPVKTGNVMDFYEVEIGLPDGGITHWDLIHHSGGAAVLPIDENGNIIFVRQYRIGIDRELLEIPAGKSEPGEDPLATIRREMEEEIGYRSDSITKLMEFWPAPAYSEERTMIYLADNLIQTETRPDADEFLQIERYSLEEAVAMVRDGRIVDGKTIAAVMTFASQKK